MANMPKHFYDGWRKRRPGMAMLSDDAIDRLIARSRDTPAAPDLPAPSEVGPVAGPATLSTPAESTAAESLSELLDAAQSASEGLNALSQAAEAAAESPPTTPSPYDGTGLPSHQAVEIPYVEPVTPPSLEEIEAKDRAKTRQQQRTALYEPVPILPDFEGDRDADAARRRDVGHPVLPPSAVPPPTQQPTPTGRQSVPLHPPLPFLDGGQDRIPLAPPGAAGRPGPAQPYPLQGTPTAPAGPAQSGPPSGGGPSPPAAPPPPPATPPPDDSDPVKKLLGSVLPGVFGKNAEGDKDVQPGSLALSALVGGGMQGLIGGGPGGLGATAALGGLSIEAAMADPVSAAVIQAVKMAKAGLVDAPGAVIGTAKDMAQTQDFGKMGSAMMGGGADAAGNMATAMAMDPFSQAILRTTQGVLLLGKAGFDAFQAIRDWSTNLHTANTQFAEYSASMAGVKAQQEVRQIQLDRERGERRANTARELAESRDRLNRAIAPIEDAWGGLMNQLGTYLNSALTPVVEAIADRLGVKDAGAGDTTAVNGLGEQMISEAFQRDWVKDYGMGRQMPNGGRRIQVLDD